MPSNELAAVETALNAGQLDRAEQLLLQSSGPSPLHGEAWYYLGMMFIRAGRDDRAVVAIGNAIRLVGDFFEGLNDLAILLSRMGQPAEAILLLDRALGQKPMHPFPWLNKGVALERLGRLEEAESSYRKATDLRADYVEAWCNL